MTFAPGQSGAQVLTLAAGMSNVTVRGVPSVTGPAGTRTRSFPAIVRAWLAGKVTYPAGARFASQGTWCHM